VNSYPFGSGRPDPGSFPNRGLADAAARILPEMGGELALYPGALGYAPLRKLMSDRFERREGAKLPPGRMALTTGSMQGVTLCVQALVKKPGDPVVIEEFSYSGTLGAYRKEGVELVGVPLDDDGMRIDMLSDRLRELCEAGRKPAFIYTLPTFQNPTGSVMPLARRRELLEVAAKYEVPVVEDHCYADTVYEPCQEPALITLEHSVPVVHIESLSKILGPGVRLGYFTADDSLFDHIVSYRRDAGTSSLSAAIVYEYFREEMWTHVERINQIVKEKRDLMFEKLAEFSDAFEWFSRPKGGLFIWVKLPDSTDRKGCEALAESKGIDYATGRAFHVADEDVPYLRLAFGYATLEQIEEGIPMLADCVRESANG
jgi:2-aminoadipate transaminase